MADEGSRPEPPPTDWDRIRANRWAKVSGPLHWPQHIRPISLSGTALFGLDEEGGLYWDGKPVEIRRRLDLTKDERWFALAVGFFTILGSLGAVAQGWAAAHQWSCQAGYVAKGCPQSK